MKQILFFFALITTLQIAAQNTFYIGPGATVTTTGGATITLRDMNLENNGTINQQPGDGMFYFSGTTDNTISGNNAPLFDIFRIAKAGTAKVLLQRSINVGSSVVFTAGLIDLNNNNIFLSPAALLTGEDETSRITGTIGGFVEITSNLNNPSFANPGNLGASITSTANLGGTIIRRGHKSQTNGFGGGNSVFRYYDIIPSNNTVLNATLNFRYFDAELNGLTENILTLWKSSNNTLWVDQGFSRRSAVANYVERNAIADFSRWTLSTPGNPLPVLFTQFNVKCNNTTVDIKWKTAQELNSSHFNVLRSTDGSNWTIIGTVPAAGNSSTEKSYSFVDLNPATGIIFYRIAEVDLDLSEHYTSILRNECGGQMNNFKVWPNPVQHDLFLNINATVGSQVSIKMYDNKGALVKDQQGKLLPGNNQLILNTHGLAKGTYIIIASWDEGNIRKVEKIMKQY